MWFLVRAVFWLSIVYAAIFWPNEPVTGPSGMVRKAQDLLGKTIAMAQAEAQKACLRSPGACLEGALTLSPVVGELRSGGKVTAPPRPATVDELIAANKSNGIKP
jgi:hypothetical protein